MEQSHHSPAESHDAHPIDLRKSVKLYLLIGGVLLFFTLVTVAVAFGVDLGDVHYNIALGLAIAAFKVSLVALIFMHLNHERGLVYKILLFTVIFFAGLMFLCVMAWYDPIPPSPRPD